MKMLQFAILWAGRRRDDRWHLCSLDSGGLQVGKALFGTELLCCTLPTTAQGFRIVLCFVNERKADYHRMVEQFEETGLVLMVARNIGVWLSRSNTLSVLDTTILTGVTTNPRLLAELKEVFRAQVSSLGYGKEVFGTLEFININSILVQSVCSSCKSWKVRRIGQDEGHCYTCTKSVTISQLPRLEGKITERDPGLLLLSPSWVV